MGIHDSIASSINSIVYQSGSKGVSSGIMGAIQSAATKTGVDFSYLMQKASVESNFDPSAKAATSSATGLFQFTSQTWLQMVKTNGAQYGLGGYASQITADSTGHLSVSNPATKHAILALRNDPTVSAEMAGELDKQNAASLQQTVGGKIGKTELYLAHFLGASGASDFISEMRANPTAKAASVLPTAAASNSSVFYDKAGNARSLQQIYQHFASKFDGSTTGTQYASASSTSGVIEASATPVSMAAATAAFTPKLMQVSSLYSTGSATGSADAVPVSGTRAASVRSAATTGASTLFTAMVLGQMNANGLDPTSALSSSLHQMDDKKKNAMSALASVA